MHVLGRTQNQPLPTLETYVILLSAINLLYRISPSSFDRSREMLEELVTRAPFHPIPLAWLARWYILRRNQGWSDDPTADAQKALDYCNRALDANPGCPLALAVDGFAHLQFRKRFDIASDRFNLALKANPNESLGWLWKGIMHTFSGEGQCAVAATERALRLSPLDPRRSHYQAIASAAAAAAGQYDRAIELAQQSLRINGGHASALRSLAVSQVWSGRLKEARETVAVLLRIEPALTVSQYIHRHPAGELETGRRNAEALRLAGLPG
jgi:tetratricopeptide (TPR) repeat protein